VLGAHVANQSRDSLSRQFEQLLQQINAGLEKHERLSGLVLIGEEWSVENGCLTPTLKVKRPALETRYGKYLEQWAEQKSAVTWAAA
jgi:long-subunit acyl-CoA synthetase (AMP-forming)